MGYNRGGKRRTDRLKRRKRFENRLAEKLQASETPAHEGLGQKVKHVAQEAVAKVGEAVHSVAEKIKHAVKK